MDQLKIVFLNGLSRPLSFLVFFIHTLHFLQQINVKNVPPVDSAGIGTHHL